MINEEIDETEFYQQDFTTASDWEIFISKIEETVNQWKIDDVKNIPRDTINNIWSIKSENLVFVDTEFEFSHFKKNSLWSFDVKQCDPFESSSNTHKITNSVDLKYDFALFDVKNVHEHSNISHWYGLNEYFVLSPAGGNSIQSESKIKILLSSLYIAVGNLGLEIPVFLQIKEKWQKCYLGVHDNNQFRTNFEMVHLKRGPQHSQHLTGLLNLFSSKIMSTSSMNHIISSVQFRYELTDFGKSCWKQDLFTTDSEKLNASSLLTLPFGITMDPVKLIQLNVTWFNIPSYKVNDSQAFSEFNATKAHQWSILAKFSDQYICLLSDCLTEYLNLLRTDTTAHEVLGIVNSLEALAESKVSDFPSILTRAARNSFSGGGQKYSDAIPDDVLALVLYFLFPDAEPNEPSNPYNIKSDKKQNESDATCLPSLDKDCKGFKTCPPDSLVWRLSVLSAILHHSVGSKRAFSQLWYEFVQEMRYRWENNIIIPGLLRELPDLRTCLLNQKLQMLNVCIERKKAREDSQKELNFDSAEGSSTDDEEFYDCADKPYDDVRKIQPAGRLGKFKDLKLIETGEYFYIPITQEPVPKTEDQLDEDADVLLKLGADAQGSEMRAKLMSASLLSDMESFKAANPGAVLEDFVRWYSPRDWEEIDEEDQWGQKKGQLSRRMLIEGNIWAEMWKTAKQIPANKQKLLFVDTREAEKVLHFLESRTVAQISELLMPTLFQASIYKLEEELTPLRVEHEEGSNQLQNLIKLCERISRENRITSRRVESFVQEMSQLELVISKINSFHYKFNPSGNVDDLRESVRDIVNGKEIIIDKNSELGTRLHSLFSDAHRNSNMMKEENSQENYVFSNPCEREFVMRVYAVRPALASSMSPQFLRAILSKNEFRLVGAFCEDISFF